MKKKVIISQEIRDAIQAELEAIASLKYELHVREEKLATFREFLKELSETDT